MAKVGSLGAAFAVLLFVLLVRVAVEDPAAFFVANWHRAFDGGTGRDVVTSRATTSAEASAPVGLIYGRVTTDDGAVYEGRLRWGGDEEAMWSNYFNGFKTGNPWADHVAREQLPKERLKIGAFGLELAGWERQLDLRRPFMVRFGDIVRIEPRGREFLVTLKSGTVFVLDRYSADDLADGVRVWDTRSGVVDLSEWRIRSIEFFPAPQPAADPHPLYGTVYTRERAFTGLIQWDRKAALRSDELRGHTVGGEVSLIFDEIRAISRGSGGSSRVMLLDGRELDLGATRGVGLADRGIYVDDPRYGRVLVSWDAFQRVDFHPGGSAPTYDDFPAGRWLAGSVVTRSGRRFTGRLVYDLDESETTETLDAPWQGVDYTIPFELIATVVLSGPEERGIQHARVILDSGEALELERSGDLGDQNAGMLVFNEGRENPEYVPWTEIERIEFDQRSSVVGR